MAMTEKQGGSDVRANTTRAEPAGDGTYEITGHKWFCSYPPCDVFLTLAQAPAGLSCFLFEGTRPGLPHPAAQGQARHALAAVERGRVPRRARPADRRGGPRRGDDHPHGQPHAAGLPARLDRVDALGSGPGRPPHPPPQRVRQAAGRAAGDAERARRPGRRVGGGDRHRDADRPLLRRGRRAFRRFATAVSKYWVCKRAAPHAAEALECLGGNGYVEESGMPRLLRDAPLNSIWEGSGNVAALDVLRAIVQGARGPAGVHGRVRARPRRQRAARRPPRPAARPPSRRRTGADARRVVEDLALALQASLLVRDAPLRGGRRVLRRAARRGRPRLRHAAGQRGRAGDRGARARELGRGHAPLRGRRPSRAHHAQPARARQRDHARDAARAGRVRRAGQPRPGRPRDRADRGRQGLLRRLRPGRVRRAGDPQPRPVRSRGTRSSTGR